MYVHSRSPILTSGYDRSLTFWQKLELSASEGTSTHWPVTSNFQPWYAQRMPDSSTRANHSDAPRWAQNSSMRPYRPSLSRKASSRSPSSLMRTWGQSSSGSSSASSAGIQYCRNRAPIGVPGPVCVSSSLISRRSTTSPSRGPGTSWAPGAGCSD